MCLCVVLSSFSSFTLAVRRTSVRLKRGIYIYYDDRATHTNRRTHALPLSRDSDRSKPKPKSMPTTKRRNWRNGYRKSVRFAVKWKEMDREISLWWHECTRSFDMVDVMCFVRSVSSSRKLWHRHKTYTCRNDKGRILDGALMPATSAQPHLFDDWERFCICVFVQLVRIWTIEAFDYAARRTRWPIERQLLHSNSIEIWPPTKCLSHSLQHMLYGIIVTSKKSFSPQFSTGIAQAMRMNGIRPTVTGYSDTLYVCGENDFEEWQGIVIHLVNRWHRLPSSTVTEWPFYVKHKCIKLFSSEHNVFVVVRCAIRVPFKIINNRIKSIVTHRSCLNTSNSACQSKVHWLHNIIIRTFVRYWVEQRFPAYQPKEHRTKGKDLIFTLERTTAITYNRTVKHNAHDGAVMLYCFLFL